MKAEKVLRFSVPLLLGCAALLLARATTRPLSNFPIDHEQIPQWSSDDLNFFLHGTMSTEVFPEAVLRAFMRTYASDLFPTNDLSHLGLIPDPDFGWPIGFGRAKVKHLGGLSSVGINCASCHVARVDGTGGSKWVLGGTSHFDVEAFFGAAIVATFRTGDAPQMKRFLAEYLRATDPDAGEDGQALFDKRWREQEDKIVRAIADDPVGAKGVAPGELHKIDPADVRLDKQSLEKGRDLAACADSMLRLFHNIRAALHVPDQPPEKPPPASGPGRNDAFGLLSAGLLGMPQPYAPTKFGLVWNVGERRWVHWDGNTNSPIARNLLASLGLGAPIKGTRADLDFAMIKRQTDISEQIRSPRYPFAVDEARAARGAPLFETHCNSCHGGPESDKRLYPIAEIGTDPHRAELFTEKQAERFNKFLAQLEGTGYSAPKESGVRSTGKYWAATLKGVWARSPYLHNGSVRTMQELLTPTERAPSFHRGSTRYEENALGYTDEGAYVLDTRASGNSNAGHDYGTGLTAEEKRDLIEYLKTL